MQKWILALIGTMSLAASAHAASLECNGVFEYGKVTVGGSPVQGQHMNISFTEEPVSLPVTDFRLEGEYLVVGGIGFHKGARVEFEIEFDRRSRRAATMFIGFNREMGFEVPLDCELPFATDSADINIELEPRLPIELPIKYPHVPHEEF